MKAFSVLMLHANFKTTSRLTGVLRLILDTRRLSIEANYLVKAPLITGLVSILSHLLTKTNRRVSQVLRKE